MRILSKAGVFNPELLSTLPGAKKRAMARLCDRMDAATAHKHEEARRGGNPRKKVRR